MTRRARADIGLSLLAGSTLLAGLAAPGAAAERAGGTLESLNRRWSGARCILREGIALKDKQGSDGWFRSYWVLPGPRWKFHSSNTGALFRVSDRRPFATGWVLAGTAFRAEGWSFEDPRKQKGIGLDLRLEGTEVRARLTLHSSFGRDRGIEDLEEMERWARIDLFRVEAADEALAPVEMPPRAPPVAPARPEPSRPPAGEAHPSPTVEMVAAAVEPNRLHAGETIDLVLTYRVGAQGAAGRPVERRTILRDGDVLVALEAEARRAAGLHRSTLPMTLPNDLAPGVYELRGEVVDGSRSSSQSTLFQVLEDEDPGARPGSAKGEPGGRP